MPRPALRPVSRSVPFVRPYKDSIFLHTGKVARNASRLHATNLALARRALGTAGLRRRPQEHTWDAQPIQKHGHARLMQLPKRPPVDVC